MYSVFTTIKFRVGEAWYSLSLIFYHWMEIEGPRGESPDLKIFFASPYLSLVSVPRSRTRRRPPHIPSRRPPQTRSSPRPPGAPPRSDHPVIIYLSLASHFVAIARLDVLLHPLPPLARGDEVEITPPTEDTSLGLARWPPPHT
jgi:hypothetical protein